MHAACEMQSDYFVSDPRTHVVISAQILYACLANLPLLNIKTEMFPIRIAIATILTEMPGVYKTQNHINTQCMERLAWAAPGKKWKMMAEASKNQGPEMAARCNMHLAAFMYEWSEIISFLRKCNLNVYEFVFKTSVT